MHSYSPNFYYRNKVASDLLVMSILAGSLLFYKGEKKND